MCTSCIPNWEPPTPGDGETFNPEPDVVRPNGSREELAAIGRALGEAAVPKDRQCTYVDCELEAVNGHVCVRHERRIA